MKFRKRYLWAIVSIAIHPTSWAEQQEIMRVWSSPVSAAATNIIDPQTMTRLDKSDVARALSLVPGVILQKSGNRNESQVKVRGFDSRQVPVFFDGVPVYIPYDGNLDLGRFLTSDVASVEVTKGYSSLLQGANQMGGAINITTPRPNKPLAASAGYRQGWSRSHDQTFDTHAALGVSNDLGYLQLSGSQLKQNGLGLPHGVDNTIAGQQGRIMNSASNDKRGVVKLGFTPRASDEYVLSWIKQEGEKQNPPYAGHSNQASRYWQWPEYDKESYYYQGTSHLGERFTLKSRLYRDNFKNTLLMYNSLTDLHNKQGNYSHYDDYSNGAGLQLAADMRDSDLLSFAINWKDDVHREKGARNAPYDRYKDRTWSTAMEYQWALSDALDLVGAISYDWRKSLQGLKYEKNGSITHYDDNKQHAFNHEVMTRYHVTPQNTLSLAWSDKTRFPTLKERYTTSKPAHNQISLVNPHLKPERARGVDLTWNSRFSERWSYEVSAYYNRVTDAILSISITDNVSQNRNSGRVDYSGVDLSLKGSPWSWLEIGTSYGLIHTEVKRQEAGKITDLPVQTLNAWLTFKPLEALEITLSEEARSTSYSNSDGSRQARGFAISHLRADYAVGYGFSLNASVNNLFDSRYAYNEGFIEQGRNFWTGIEYKF